MKNFFRAVPLFKGALRGKKADDFLSRIRLVSYRKNETIYKENEKTPYLYLVHDGEIHLVKHDATRIIQQRGSIFGEVSFFTGEPHSTSALAVLDSSIYLIPGDLFLSMMQEEPILGQNLAFMLTGRLRNQMSSFQEIPSRVIAFTEGNFAFHPESFFPALAKELSIENGNVLFIGRIKNEHTDIHNDTSDGGPLKSILDLWPSLGPEDLRAYFHRPGRAYDYIPVEELTGGYIDLIPPFLALLKKYYSTIIIQISDSSETSIPRRFLTQADLVIQIEEHHVKEKRIAALARRISGQSRGLCLGGGGARAFAHIGVIQAFEEEGIEFDAVAGTSMGAIIGAAFARGMSSAEMLDFFQSFLSSRNAIFDKNLPLVSFFRGSKLSSLIYDFFGDWSFEELKIPFYCNASDLNTGRMIVFESGELAPALRATVGLPGLFPPFLYEGMSLVDGSVLNSLPGNILKERQFSRILGVSVNPDVDYEASVTRPATGPGIFRGVFDYINMPPILKIITRSIAIQSAELLRSKMKDMDYVLTPDVGSYDMFDFDNRDRLYQEGYLYTKNKISKIKEILGRQKI